MELECLLIADDVTGACDAAGPFAARGYRTVFCMGTPCEGEVLAVSTESRNLGREELPRVVAETARRLAGFEPRILFKKIDSTLRGNVGAEVALALEAFGCDAAIVTPAFPAMNRVVEAGVLRVTGADFTPIELAAYWREQGLACNHVGSGEVARAIDAGAQFVSVDGCCDADLDALVAAGMASGRRLLWAGSAGLASALARAAGKMWSEPPACHAGIRSANAGAVLFCIGSDHPVTVQQQRNLLEKRRAISVSAETTSPECIAAALRDGVHVALWIPRGRVGAERLRELIGKARAPMLVSGGDTASLVFRALGVRAIELLGEISPGIPHGVMPGGVAVATKSGGFGGPDALILVADTLR